MSVDGPVAPAFRFSYLGGLWLYDRIGTFRLPPLLPSLLLHVPRGSVALASAAGVAAAVVDVASGALVWLPPRLPLWSPGRGQKCRGAMVTGSSATSGVVEFTGAAMDGQEARVTVASTAKEMGSQLCRCLLSCGCGCSCILEA